MAQQISTGQSMIVTTNKGDYYVIPMSALEQFRATSEQRAQIDLLAREEGTEFYSGGTATEESAESDFASEVKTTAHTHFHTLQPLSGGSRAARRPGAAWPMGSPRWPAVWILADSVPQVVFCHAGGPGYPWPAPAGYLKLTSTSPRPVASAWLATRPKLTSPDPATTVAPSAPTASRVPTLAPAGSAITTRPRMVI
jgi:hypothetical protein